MKNECQGSASDKDCPQSSQEEIGAIPVRGQAQLTSQLEQPLYCVPRPDLGDMVNEQSCDEHKDEYSTHTFLSLNSYILDIKAVFLIKAVGVFNSRAMSPLGIDSSCISLSIDGDVCEKHQIMLSIRVMSNQCP